MKIETLLEKIARSSDEEKELIAQIIHTSRSFQKDIGEALRVNKLTLSAFNEVRHKRFSNYFSRYILDVLPQDNNIVDDYIEQIKSDPLEAIKQILSRSEIIQKLSKFDPLIIYRIKGIESKWRLLFGEELPLDSTEVASLLNIARQTVNKQRKKGKLLGICLGNQGYLYPACQFQNGQVIKGLEPVLKELQEYETWTQLSFLKTGDVRLQGATPLEKLKEGDIDTVIWAASCYGKQISA